MFPDQEDAGKIVGDSWVSTDLICLTAADNQGRPGDNHGGKVHHLADQTSQTGMGTRQIHMLSIINFKVYP